MKLKAEVWDKGHLIIRKVSDGMIHCTLYCDRHLNEEIFKNVLINVMENISILRSTFKERFFKPYWKVNEVSLKDYYKLIETNNLQCEIEKFEVENIKHSAKCQMQIRLIRDVDKDAISLIFNHMCFDGAEMYEFIYKIAKVYTGYFKYGNNFSSTYRNGNRAMEQIYNDFNSDDRKTAQSLYKNISKVKNNTIFPFEKNTIKDVPKIIKDYIEQDVFIKLKERGKKLECSINEIFIAAYTRALFCNAKNKDNTFYMSNMINLRRYLSKKKAENYTNLTGMFNLELHNKETFFETLIQVKELMNEIKKDKFLGLHGYPLLKLAYKIFPYYIAKFIVKLGVSTPNICLSNIGIFQENKLTMGDVNIVDGYAIGAVKYKPCLLVGFTTFNNKITMSCAIKCNEQDEKLIANLFSCVKSEINSFLLI